MKTRTFIVGGLAVHARTITTSRPLIFRRAWLWAGFLAFAAIVFAPQAGQAAVIEAWVQRYSNVNAADQAVKVVRDAAGDIIVTGTSSGGIPGADMLTIKYSGANGSVLWKQRYNGPANGDDRPSALVVDASGNVVVTGTSNYDPSYTAKYAATDGALLWERRYNNPAEARALAVDGSGNVVVTGYSGGTNNNYDYYTAKYAAADGALLWEKRYNGPRNGTDVANAVAVDGSGNVVVTGTSNNDSYTAKYAAADGALLWESRYSGPGNNYYHPSALTVDGSGNVVVTGNSLNGTNSLDYYTAKYAAADGALLWEQRYNGPANLVDIANAVAVDDSGNVVVTAYIDGTTGEGLNGGDYYTVKYAAADGALLWERRYDGPANSVDYAQAVTVDGSGNVVVTGTSWNGESYYDSDYYTAKYAAADGALLWEQRYDGRAPSHGSAREVAVDGNGNVAVTGITYHPDSSVSEGPGYTAKYAAADGSLLWEKRHGDGAPFALNVDTSGNVVVTGYSSSDYYTAKYAAADGALLWEKRGSSTGWANAVDGTGNVVVTGTSYNGTNSDYYTAKYAAADGALLWERRYNGPANGGDFANAVAVDGSGNVVVTGYSYGSSTNSDYYTAKYAAADGALLWERRYNGPANGVDYASAVAVDGSGNVAVTGSSFSSSTNADYYTAKYAAADGALLWEKRYNGPANRDLGASALAVDGSGNVVVTGTSFNGTNSDYYTAKYAASDGALLWEMRYNGPANSYDYARAVAVDGSGNVVVTGSSAGTIGINSTFDYYTAKYAAADGALLWEKRFTGPASVGDSSHCLALGPDGMVAVTGTSNGGYATVVYRDLPAVSIDLISTGVRLRFTGVPNRSYNIERAPAVTGPWSTINTQTAPSSGAFEYLDTNPPAAAAFYRTSEP